MTGVSPGRWGRLLRTLAANPANWRRNDRVERPRRLGPAEFKLAPPFPDLDVQEARFVRTCAAP